MKNSKYKNERSAEHIKASEYLISLFGNDWATNLKYKKAEERFIYIHNTYKREVENIISQKVMEHKRNGLEFLFELSSHIYHVILTQRECFSHLEKIEYTKHSREKPKTDEQMFSDAIKQGNRWAKRYVMSNYKSYSKELLQLANNHQEPSSYKYKNKQMLGNISV